MMHAATNSPIKIVVITGATSGIGLALSKAVLRAGFALIGVGRNRQRCAQALAEMGVQPAHKVAFLPADLSLPGETRALAEAIRAKLDEWQCIGLDGLVLNAASVPFRQQTTAEGLDWHWAVNYLSGFLLARELQPQLAKANPGRIVAVTSASHRMTRLDWGDIQTQHPYNPLLAYKRAKLAQVLFAAEFNRRLSAASGVRAFAADPGLVKTEIGMKGGSAWMNAFWRLRRLAGASPEKAADDIFFLLTSQQPLENGALYWRARRQKLPSHYARNVEAAARLWAVAEKMCAEVLGG